MTCIVNPVFAGHCTKRNPALTGQMFMHRSATWIERASLDQAESSRIRTVSGAPRASGLVGLVLSLHRLHIWLCEIARRQWYRHNSRLVAAGTEHRTHL